MHETPMLVNVRTGTFEEYISSLAKTGRKNFKYAEKSNSDLTYARIDFQPTLIERFMRLWEQQEIAGRRRQWGFGMGFIEFLHHRNHLLCFAASITANPQEVLALHFVEKHGDYVFCHPPMYDKEAHNDRYIAKYMWFRLIQYAVSDPTIGWLDLGGGKVGSWRDLLINKEQHPGYKWLYIPEAVKESPDAAPPYVVRARVLPYAMYLDQSATGRSALHRYVVDKLVSLLWRDRKRRLRRLSNVFNRVVGQRARA